MRATSVMPFVAAVILSSCASAPQPLPSVTVAVPPPPPPEAAPVAPTDVANDAPSEAEAVIPILGTDPTWGSRTAPVTLVFFGDFQCPYTGKSTRTIRALEEKYGPNAIRVVWKNSPLPFHAYAHAAAEATVAVQMLGGNDAFWKFYDAGFANQHPLGPEIFEGWAQSAGVDLPSYRRLVAGHAGASKVDADYELAKKVASGTPAFFVNGVAIRGSQPEEKFVTVIDAEMQKANAAILGGTSPGLVYAAMAKENYKARPPAAPEARDDTTTVWNVPAKGAPVRGSDAALVTIVEFGDYQCPFTKRAEATLETIRSTYGDKVRIVWRDQPLPFHARAVAAAELAREARVEKGQDGFWAVHDALFASQPKLEEADLDTIAVAAGLDPVKAHAAFTHDKRKTQIQDDMDLGDDVLATGTPTFFINGRKLTGSQAFEKYKTIIDEEIAHAEDVVAKGTPRAALYETLIRGGKVAPLPEMKTITAATKAPFRGSPTAKVVIEELADFQCPFCKRVEPTLTELLADHSLNVKLVWRDLPLPVHANAELAAEAAREAQRQKGNDGFWKMHDKIFAGQTSPGIERAALDGYAQDIGLDMTAFDNALDQHTMAPLVALDAKAAADAAIGGTPGFVIGGYFLNGSQPINKFRRLIGRVMKDGPAKAAGAPKVAAAPK